MNSKPEGSRLQGEAAARAILICAMAVWGINLSAVKALTSSLDVHVVASIRMAVAALTLTVLLRPSRGLKLVLSPAKLAGLVVCSVLMVYANQLLFAAGLARTSATNAALVMALGPLVSSAIAAALLKEHIGARRLVGISIGLAGVGAVVLNRHGAVVSGGGIGDLLLLASVVCFAAGGVLVQRLSAGLSALEISWVVHVVGASMLTVHTLLGAPAAFDPLLSATVSTWSLICFSGVGATALAAIAWNQAIAKIGLARTSMAFYWVPIFGLAFAVLALGEDLSVWHVVGLVCVIGGSRLAGSSRKKSGAD